MLKNRISAAAKSVELLKHMFKTVSQDGQNLGPIRESKRQLAFRRMDDHQGIKQHRSVSLDAELYLIDRA